MGAGLSAYVNRYIKAGEGQRAVVVLIFALNIEKESLGNLLYYKLVIE